MKKLLTLLVTIWFSALPFLGQAQNYGNEWIDFSQQYYKIKITTSGIHRISYATLVSSGIPVQSLNPKNIQIFGRGEEQYIYIHGENDNAFNAGDYIEFYGMKNDGWLDQYIYNNPADQPNSDFSLFNDTAVYFLTWNTLTANRRLTVETDRNFTGYTAESNIWYTSRMNYTSSYYDGKTDEYGNTDPRYTDCEGWFGNEMSIPSGGGQGTYSLSVSTPRTYTSGSNATISFLLLGQSNFSGLNPDHHMMISFAGESIDTLYEGYVPLRFSRSVSPTYLSSGNVNFTFTLPNDLGSGADRNTVSYIDIRYPRQTDLGSSSSLIFDLNSTSSPKAYLEMVNLGSSVTDTVVVHDITDHRRILTSRSGSTVRFLVPNSSGSTRTCFLVSESSVISISSLTPVNTDAANYAKFIDYSEATYDNRDYLIITHRNLLQKANEYAAYRNNTGYNSLVAEVNMIYDQFAYGINKHPIGIRNFASYAVSEFSDTIKGMFLMGKGYRAGGSVYNYRFSTTYNALTLVPSFGNPPSDILFTSGLNDGNYAPAIPTGRLAARTPTEVSWYLIKMQDYETEQNQPYNPSNPLAGSWMKRALHFAGGSSFSEAQTLLSYLNAYRDTLINPYFGASVVTYTKTSTAPIQQNISDEVRDKINEGVGIMNFFGHAAGIGFDISINNPADYSNYKRYPFLIANSCFAGDLYQATNSSSEAFVLIENKGTIGYLGSISKSLAPYLNIYSSELMGRIARRNYGQPIGQIIQQTIQTVQNTSSISYLRDVCLEMTLHGDPVLTLGGSPQPDFLLTSGSVFYNPVNVTSELDSFSVNIIAYNAGMAVYDSVILEVTRVFPDFTQETIQKMIPSPAYADTIEMRFPVSPINGVGLNTFQVMIDAFNSVDESVETNNSISSNLFIASNDIAPVYPYEFSVIPDTFVTLTASTGYAMAAQGTYYFQIDTTDSFDSPFLKESGPIIQSGGIVEWNLPFAMTSMPDSTVYFWRVSSATTSVWRESSFQYITGKYGWGQDHFFQYKKNNFQYVSYNKPARILEFINNVVTISAQTGFYPYIQWSEEWYKIDNSLKGQWSCTDYNGDGMKFAVFDSISIEPWVNTDPEDDGYGPSNALNCRLYDYFDFDFYTGGEPWFSRMTSFLDSVPDGFYVLAFSHRNHNAENYPEALYQAFEELGSTMIRTVPNNIPYLIFGRKGFPALVDEKVGSAISSIISGSWGINTNWQEGYIESTTIGPALEWGSLHWKVSSFEPGIWTDTVRLSVIGIRADGTVDTVMTDLPPVPDSLDILNLSTRINAAEFPYLKLHLSLRDDSLRTPAMLDRWHVLYEPAPETAIDPASFYTFYNDTILEGESVKLSIATRNIGPVDFPDSLMVAYWLIDNDRNVHYINNKKLRLHPVGDVIVDSLVLPTQGFSGLNSLWVEFNPVDSVTGVYDQVEQHHFNNIAEIKFFADRDRINPMLDVTFDNVHILDGDIVSANPFIEILLKDENEYLKLDDTSSIRVFMLRPGSQEYEQVFFYQDGNEVMRFYPAAATQNNVARVEYPAGTFSDGKYTLMVQARDKSGNESGSIDFKINFEVINKPAITDVMNWPNPFSTKTHFVFTLTGSEVPEFFMIQIMTVSGKIVREIDRSELGNIHIGRNITEYAWDGRDEFGDLLANGVYLYRVLVRLNGESIDKIDTPAGQYFTHEFGKMVLIR